MSIHSYIAICPACKNPLPDWHSDKWSVVNALRDPRKGLRSPAGITHLDEVCRTARILANS